MRAVYTSVKNLDIRPSLHQNFFKKVDKGPFCTMNKKGDTGLRENQNARRASGLSKVKKVDKVRV